MGMEQLAWLGNQAPDLWQQPRRFHVATVSRQTEPFPSPSSSCGVLPMFTCACRTVVEATSTTIPPLLAGSMPQAGAPSFLCHRAALVCRRSAHPTKRVCDASVSPLAKIFLSSGHRWLITGHATPGGACTRCTPECTRSASGRALAPRCWAGPTAFEPQQARPCWAHVDQAASQRELGHAHDFGPWHGLGIQIPFSKLFQICFKLPKFISI
jgi:hypothetical protein